MSISEQKEIKKKNYTEAIRYMDNAKETLKKAGKKDDRYSDGKYVKTACGTAYNAVLLALDAYLLLKQVKFKTKSRKDKDDYERELAKLDKKLLDNFIDAYNILHLSGYYDGVKNAKVIMAGFEVAYNIINKIKPAA